MQQPQQIKIRVLVGDSSVRSRMVLSGMIDAEPNLEVVDTAQTKEELLCKAVSSRPDFIITQYGFTMSGNLPAFTPVFGDGSSLVLMASERIAMQAVSDTRYGKLHGHFTEPVMAINSERKEGCKVTLMKKLREYVVKYTFGKSDEAVKRQAATDEKFNLLRYTPNDLAPKHEAPLSVIVLGASTGGSTAIEYLIKDLQVTQPTVVLVAVHMPEKFTKRLAQRLQKLTKWRVEEGLQGMVLSPQTIVIAPGGFDMRVTKKSLRPNQLMVELEPSSALDSPSINALMASAAACSQEQVMGVIMTGMGMDGTTGAQEIVKRGGMVIAQDKSTSSIYGMAKVAVESGTVHGVFALGQINSIINRFVADRSRSHMLQQIAVG